MTRISVSASEFKVKFEYYDPITSFTDNSHFASTSNQKSLDFYSQQGRTTELYRMGKAAYEYLDINSQSDMVSCFEEWFYCIGMLIDAAFNHDVNSDSDLTDEPLSRDEVESGFGILMKFSRNMAQSLRSSALEASTKGDNQLLDDLCINAAINILMAIDGALVCIFVGDMEGYSEALIHIATQHQLLNEFQTDKETTRIRRKERARFAAKKRHGPINKAKEVLKAIWATGKYSSKDVCAEQESAGLGMSFSTARKALRNL